MPSAGISTHRVFRGHFILNYIAHFVHIQLLIQRIWNIDFYLSNEKNRTFSVHFDILPGAMGHLASMDVMTGKPAWVTKSAESPTTTPISFGFCIDFLLGLAGCCHEFVLLLSFAMI